MTKSITNEGGSTRSWRRLRATIIERDGGTCRYCGAKAYTVDHIVPRDLGGTDNPLNLVACCWDCQFPHRRPNPPVTVIPPGIQKTEEVPIDKIHSPRSLGKRSKIVPFRRGRNRGHPHAAPGDLYRFPTAKDEPQAHPTPKAQDALERMLQVLPVDMVRAEDEIYSEHLAAGKREAFAAMAAHQEMAAVILAAGGTQRQAADYAGISANTVGKYLQDDDFRTRVREQRELLLSSIQGRVISELERRTSGEMIMGLEVGDLLRIMDKTTGAASERVGGVSGGKQTTTQVQVNVDVANYNALLANLSDDGSGEEGETFPVARVVGPGVAGGVPSGAGTVPALGPGETDG